MTAEFAVALPAVALVLAVCLAGVQAVSIQVRLTDAAADAARTLARGDGVDLAAARLSAAVPGATLSVDSSGDLVCVAAGAPAGSHAVLAALTVSARSCALGGGL
ncbi:MULTISPECIES: TadE family type IV pilus minor pilin [unclassified Leifsonia]|uniref:TadE family type IV pilus minor pilin n=1 Tax=unclassified Leifsonia TaxID=2663824 RepID=UPI000A66EC03|nr:MULTISPECIES: TadE family type IV pilus minor pilin [unclassified Leifsonia]